MEDAMVTTTCWVPRGFAAQHPNKVELDEKEFSRIAEIAKLQLEDAQEDLDDAKNGTSAATEDSEEDGGVALDAGEVTKMDVDADVEMGGVDGSAIEKKKKGKVSKGNDDDLAEYDLDHYDDTPPGSDDDESQTMGMFGNVKSLAYHAPGEADPYITLAPGETLSDDEDEREELQILPSDNLLLVGKVEDEVAHLEVYVYEDEADNLYVHHDIMLPAIPLCVEWINIPVGRGPVDKDARGNFAAIGTTGPDIELWDLDVVDSMFPNAILGAGADEKKPKKGKKKKKKANDSYHVDAIQALAGNRAHRNLLASASADKTVKLWDLSTAQCAKSYSYHSGQVCALDWNPGTHNTTLLSGSYDRTVVWADMRAPDAKHPTWSVDADVEHLQWDPHDPNFFYVSTESGRLYMFDSRNAPKTPSASKHVWQLQAHDKPLSSFSINPVIPGFIATASQDKTVKLWSTSAEAGAGPSMVVSRNPDVGKIFSVGWGPDKEVGFRLAVAGSNGSCQVWDASTNGGVRRVFGDRLKNVRLKDKEDRVVGVKEQDEDESESGDEDAEMDSDDSGDDV